MIATHAGTKAVIEKYSFAFKKSFGQNFLIDPHVLNKIISASNIDKDDLVIEVGPGIGGLTEALAEKAGKVIAVEIDTKLIPILKETLSEYDNIEVINSDILKLDLMEVIKDHKSVKLVANLPYYITTPIIMDILERELPIKSMTVMVQKEVASRMSAKPSTKDYGSLTLAIGYYATTYLVANVPSNCFMPRPNVDSAVVRLDILDKPAVNVTDSELLFKLIKIAFAQRRKTFLNCIFSLGEFELTKEEIAKILEESGLDAKVRGETLTLDEFAVLTEVFTSKGFFKKA